MFKKTNAQMNLLGIAKKVETGKIRFDLEIQRRSVWSTEQKQNIIDSLIFDYPVPPLYFVDKGDEFYWVLDGQQRMRSVAEFIADNYPLNDNIQNYIDEYGNIHELAGKIYSELSKEVQTKINSTTLNTYNFKNITDEEINIMFKRLNAGSPFKAIELVRIDMPNDITKFVNEISKNEFFQDKISISDKSRIHFGDQEVILQTLMFFVDGNCGLSAKEIKEFIMDYQLTKDVKDEFKKVLNYANQVFPQEKCKYLRKTHIPVIFKVLQSAMHSKLKADDVLNWIYAFFKGQKSGSAYNQTCTSGSSKKDNVKKRYNILKSNFDSKFMKKAG